VRFETCKIYDHGGSLLSRALCMQGYLGMNYCTWDAGIFVPGMNYCTWDAGIFVPGMNYFGCRDTCTWDELLWMHGVDLRRHWQSCHVLFSPLSTRQLVVRFVYFGCLPQKI
jgi:hypothetical protein